MVNYLYEEGVTQMKKKIGYLLIMTLIVTACLGALAGCGSQENAYAGKWVAIAVTLGDYTTPQTAADSQYTIDIAKDSSAQINVEGTSGSGKCSVKDNTMTLKVEGETTEGTIDGDKITFDDMFGMGTTIIFAKDGSEAMNPALYISDIEKKTLGSWKAESYKEILDDTPRTSMDGYSSMADVLSMDFKMDFANGYAVSLKVLGEDLGTRTWSFFSDTGTIDCDEYTILLEYADDGKMEVTLTGNANSDIYYTIYCVKAD